jgi:hypothetical protein
MRCGGEYVPNIGPDFGEPLIRGGDQMERDESSAERQKTRWRQGGVTGIAVITPLLNRQATDPAVPRRRPE